MNHRGKKILGIVLALLLMAAVGIALYAAFILIYSRSVIRINARGNQGYHVKDFKLKKTAGSSSLGALFRIKGGEVEAWL